MAIESFYVFGIATDSGSSPITTTLVRIYDVTADSHYNTATGASGNYYTDIADISGIEDGDTITISIISGNEVASDSFTLNIQQPSKRIDLQTSQFILEEDVLSDEEHDTDVEKDISLLSELLLEHNINFATDTTILDELLTEHKLFTDLSRTLLDEILTENPAYNTLARTYLLEMHILNIINNKTDRTLLDEIVTENPHSYSLQKSIVEEILSDISLDTIASLYRTLEENVELEDTFIFKFIMEIVEQLLIEHLSIYGTDKSLIDEIEIEDTFTSDSTRQLIEQIILEHSHDIIATLYKTISEDIKLSEHRVSALSRSVIEQLLLEHIIDTAYYSLNTESILIEDTFDLDAFIIQVEELLLQDDVVQSLARTITQTILTQDINPFELSIEKVEDIILYDTRTTHKIHSLTEQLLIQETLVRATYQIIRDYIISSENIISGIETSLSDSLVVNGEDIYKTITEFIESIKISDMQWTSYTELLIESILLEDVREHIGTFYREFIESLELEDSFSNRFRNKYLTLVESLILSEVSYGIILSMANAIRLHGDLNKSTTLYGYVNETHTLTSDLNKTLLMLGSINKTIRLRRDKK